MQGFNKVNLRGYTPNELGKIDMNIESMKVVKQSYDIRQHTSRSGEISYTLYDNHTKIGEIKPYVRSDYESYPGRYYESKPYRYTMITDDARQTECPLTELLIESTGLSAEQFAEKMGRTIDYDQNGINLIFEPTYGWNEQSFTKKLVGLTNNLSIDVEMDEQVKWDGAHQLDKTSTWSGTLTFGTDLKSETKTIHKTREVEDITTSELIDTINTFQMKYCGTQPKWPHELKMQNTLREEIFTNCTMNDIREFDKIEEIKQICFAHSDITVDEDGWYNIKNPDGSECSVWQDTSWDQFEWVVSRDIEQMRYNTFEQALVDGVGLKGGLMGDLFNEKVGEPSETERFQLSLKLATYYNDVEHYYPTIYGSDEDTIVSIKLHDHGYWIGQMVNNQTGERMLYNTPNIDAVIDDIVTRQNQLEQTEPNWDFAKEDGMQQ